MLKTYQSILNGFIFVFYALNRQKREMVYLTLPPILSGPFFPNTIRVNEPMEYRIKNLNRTRKCIKDVLCLAFELGVGGVGRQTEDDALTRGKKRPNVT